MRYLLFLFVFISSISLAQNGINYQGAATDSDGAKLANQNISLRTSVLQGGVDGTTSYSETHNTTTDPFGLFNVVIGQGEVVSGAFDSISWGADAHFLKVELDATGGSDYSLVSTTQMMSVPYALYAENAGLDSAAVANMLSSMNFSGNSGGCNFKFPEGLNGEAIISEASEENPYLVPEGKRLYILAWKGSNPVVQDFELQFVSHMPIILSSGESLTTAGTTAGFSGLLINETPDLNVITAEFTDLNPYQVPDGKKLIILNYVGGEIKLESSFVFTDQWSTGMPIIVPSGISIETQNNYNGVKFNGYLVDKDFFADCYGVGGTSSSSSVDSAMVAEMIANSGMNEGFKNLKYPEGIGQPVILTIGGENNYVVPEGKNLYINYIYSTTDNPLQCNDIDIFSGRYNNAYFPANHFPRYKNNPYVFTSGDEISLNYSHYGEMNLFGFLVDKVVDPITHSFSTGNYEVPENKLLILNTLYSIDDNSIHVNDLIFFTGRVNNGYTSNTIVPISDEPAILNSGDIISAYSSTPSFNGYLVDEDYFINFGGGGGGSSSSSSSNSAFDNSNFAPNILSSDMFFWDANYTNDTDISYFTVPVGKQITIIGIDEGGSTNMNDFSIHRNNIEITLSNIQILDVQGLVVLTEGDSIVTSPIANINDPEYFTLLGYISDISSEFESAIVKLDNSNSSYTVPNGKKLVIRHCEGNSISGVNISFANGVNLSESYSFPQNFPFFPEGSVISPLTDNENWSYRFFGYLINQ